MLLPPPESLPPSSFSVTFQPPIVILDIFLFSSCSVALILLSLGALLHLLFYKSFLTILISLLLLLVVVVIVGSIIIIIIIIIFVIIIIIINIVIIIIITIIVNLVLVSSDLFVLVQCDNCHRKTTVLEIKAGRTSNIVQLVGKYAIRNMYPRNYCPLMEDNHLH